MDLGGRFFQSGISFEEYPIRLGSTLDGFGSAWGMFTTLHGEMYDLRTALEVSRDPARSFRKDFNQIWEQNSCSSGYPLKGFRSVPCAPGSIVIRFWRNVLSVRDKL